MVEKWTPLVRRDLTVTLAVGLFWGVIGLLFLPRAKRAVRREIARAIREFQPFQPSSPTFIVNPEGDSNVRSED